MSVLRRLATVLTVSAVCCLGLATAESGRAAAAGDKDQKGKTVTITAKDSNARVKLARGDTLQVRLEAQPSTGYLWVAAKEDLKFLKQDGKPTFERGDKDKKLIGGKVAEVLRFQAEAAGAGELELHYRRPFEKGKPAAKTFKIHVTVE